MVPLHSACDADTCDANRDTHQTMSAMAQLVLEEMGASILAGCIREMTATSYYLQHATLTFIWPHNV